MDIKFRKVHPDAQIPQYQTEGASGFDFHSVEDVHLEPGEWKAIRTGIKVELPPYTEIQIRPRSGLAFKKGVTVLNAPGTIDSDFRGEIMILLINLSKESVDLKKGARIAQGVLAPVIRARFREAANWEFTPTTRGKRGFGSTGEE
ncbi:MAG: dUTP diphosphatase [Campylobacterales bacterium]